MIAVEDLMSTNVLTLGASDVLAAADVEMKIAGIRHLPIVDVNRRVVGIVSNRDILRAAGQSQSPGSSILVSEVMTRSPHTIAPDSPASEAAALMLDHKIGALPVVNDDDVLVGIITETDFVSIAHDLLSGDRAALRRIG